MGFLLAKNIINNNNISSLVEVRKLCPFKDGDKILIGDIYYKILITDKNKKNINFFNKLKRCIPEKWHPFVDFIV